MRLIRGTPVHRINLIARIHHDKQSNPPPDLPGQETRDKRGAGEDGVSPGCLTRPSRAGDASCASAGAGSQPTAAGTG